MSILSCVEIIIRILEGEKQIPSNKNNYKDINKLHKDLIKKSTDYDDYQKLKVNAIEKLAAFYSNFLDDSKKMKQRIKEIENLAKEISKLPQDKKRNKSKSGLLPILIDDFDVNCLQQANYDLRLGKMVFTTKLGKTKIYGDWEDIIIESGDFGAFLTYEDIYIPDDLLGLISLKSEYKMKGLVNVSGFHVDPGYHGKILFSVYNAGPRDITLRCKEAVFMIMFDKLEEPVLRGYDALKDYGKGYKNIPVDIITDLKGAPISLRHLHQKYENLEFAVTIIGTILIVAIAALLSGRL